MTETFSIFQPEKYFLTKKEDRTVLHSKYIACFRKGIVIGYKPLYYLLKGSYAEQRNMILPEEERIGYKSIILLLNTIKKDLGNQELSIYITPHIFTKFVNELWGSVTNSYDFEEIMNLFLNTFYYIREEGLKKEELIGFNHFRKRYCGLSEASLILIKGKIGAVCILDTSNKIPELAGEDYLFANFQDLVSAIREQERREKYP